MANNPRGAEEPTLRIYLLGGFRAFVDGRCIEDADWRVRKAKTLVKMLALASGRTLHREQILESLWPDLDPQAGVNNLHKTLYTARRALHPSSPIAGGFLRLQDDQLTLTAPRGVWVDIEAFEEAAREAREAKTITAYRTALDMYGGELLPEDRYEDWVVNRREETQATYMDLLMESSALHEGAGQLSAAIDQLAQVVVIDPVHEQAHAGLMRLYALSGQRHQALRQYQRLGDALERELGIEPGPETQQLYQQIVQGSPRPAQSNQAVQAPAERSAQAPRSPHGPLVGRDQELEWTEDILDRLFGGEGSLLLLAGEAGVGKSRLAVEIAERVERRGGLSLMGAAYEQEQQLPYGPFVEAFDEYRERGEAPGRPSTSAESAAEIFQYLSSGGGGEQAGPGMLRPDPVDRQQFFRSVAGFLQRLAAQQPVVLVLDDLHVADEASFQLLHYLARARRETPLLLVGVFRPEDIERGGSLGEFLGNARRQRLGRRFDIGALSRPESDYLVESLLSSPHVDKAVLESVYGLAEGSPFYTEEVIEALKERGSLRQEGGRWRLEEPMPTVGGMLMEVVSSRIERLKPETQDVLRLAAAIGRESPYEVLRTGAALHEGELLESLDEALSRRIIEESERGYRFVHPVHREVLYEGMSRERRRALHVRVAEALEETGEDDHGEALAYHYQLTRTPWKAVAHVLSAARRASAVFANEQAARLYRQGIEVLRSYPQCGDPSDLPLFLEELGDVIRRTGQAAESLALYEEGMEQSSAIGDTAMTSRLRGKAALSAMTAGQVERASTLLHETLDAVSETYPEEVAVASTYYQLAQLHWHSARHRESLEAAEKALAAADTTQDESQRAQAYEVMALACHSLGDWQKGIEYELSRSSLDVPGFETDQAFDAHL